MSARGWAIALALVVPAIVLAAKPAPSAEAGIRRVEAELCKAFEVGDTATLRRDLDPTFTLVDSHGNVTDYAQNIAEVAKRDPLYSEFRNHDQVVRVYGDAAIITGITSVKGTSGGDAFAADFRFTDTWVRRKDGWKLAASHASRLATPTAH